MIHPCKTIIISRYIKARRVSCMVMRDQAILYGVNSFQLVSHFLPYTFLGDLIEQQIEMQTFHLGTRAQLRWH